MLVGVGQGSKSAPVGLKADIQDLNKAMKELGARVTKAGIRIDMPGDVLFDFDKTDLKPAAQDTLEKLAEVIRAKAKGTVRINGYTDSKGSDPYNQQLSEGRAESVKKWLTTNGNLPAAGLRAQGFGKVDPVAPNARPDGSDDPKAGRATVVWK
jgi:outer membrane protein OmpA-like peptidoglycan-associated protein